MAVIRYGAAITAYVLDPIHPGPKRGLYDLDVTTSTSTEVTMTGKNGTVITFNGTGLLTDGTGNFIGGTIQTINAFDSGGGSLVTVSGLNIRAQRFEQGFDSEFGYNLLNFITLGGNDRIYGSSKGDFLFGVFGNDQIFGGAGRDIIVGVSGNHELTGGSGPDVFVFAPGKSNTTIMDFADNGSASDDVILLNSKQYDKMVMTQEGDDVLLSFGKAGSILILDQQVGEMGADDFVFRLDGWNFLV